MKTRLTSSLLESRFSFFSDWIFSLFSGLGFLILYLMHKSGLLSRIRKKKIKRSTTFYQPLPILFLAHRLQVRIVIHTSSKWFLQSGTRGLGSFSTSMTSWERIVLRRNTARDLFYQIILGHFCILGFEVELTCNGGSCREISLK